MLSEGVDCNGGVALGQHSNANDGSASLPLSLLLSRSVSSHHRLRRILPQIFWAFFTFFVLLHKFSVDFALIPFDKMPNGNNNIVTFGKVALVSGCSSCLSLDTFRFAARAEFYVYGLNISDLCKFTIRIFAEEFVAICRLDRTHIWHNSIV